MRQFENAALSNQNTEIYLTNVIFVFFHQNQGNVLKCARHASATNSANVVRLHTLDCKTEQPTSSLEYPPEEHLCYTWAQSCSRTLCSLNDATFIRWVEYFLTQAGLWAIPENNAQI